MTQERRSYDDHTKAAVMAALLTGQAVGEIAATYNVPEATIRSWKSRQLNGEGVAVVARQKKEEIGELLFAYLRTTLQSLEVQAKHFGDTTWLKQQEAQQLAVLHGVAVDKAIRLLEAFQPGADDEAEG